MKMQYSLIDNATGVTTTHNFSLEDIHSIVGVENGEPTRAQAQHQIDIWNRSQVVHRQEFTYRLV
jgi:hypothetical protein